MPSTEGDGGPAVPWRRHALRRQEDDLWRLSPRCCRRATWSVEGKGLFRPRVRTRQRSLRCCNEPDVGGAMRMMGPALQRTAECGAAQRPGHETVVHRWTWLLILRGVLSPSFGWSRHPQDERGRREGGCRRAPTVHCAKGGNKNLHSGIQVKPNIRPSLRSGLTAYVALSRGAMHSCPRRLAADDAAPVRAATSPQRLTPACGRQDHTILPYADHTGRACDVPRSRFPALRSPSHQCGPRPPPSASVRDDRDTPLFLGPESARNIRLFRNSVSRIFLATGH